MYLSTKEDKLQENKMISLLRMDEENGKKYKAD